MRKKKHCILTEILDEDISLNKYKIICRSSIQKRLVYTITKFLKSINKEKSNVNLNSEFTLAC